MVNVKRCFRHELWPFQEMTGGWLILKHQGFGELWWEARDQEAQMDQSMKGLECHVRSWFFIL